MKDCGSGLKRLQTGPACGGWAVGGYFMTSSTLRLRSVEGRGATAGLWLIIATAAKCGSVLLFAANIALIANAPSLSPEMVGVWDILPLAAFAILAVYWTTMVFVGLWIHRAASNAHALSRGLEVSPGWAVGWYFVPFANWVMPFRAMDEIWKVSQAPESWRRGATPPILKVWWAFWVASSLFGAASSAFSRGAADESALIIGSAMGGASALAAIGAALALRRIVAQITLLQTQHARTQVF